MVLRTDRWLARRFGRSPPSDRYTRFYITVASGKPSGHEGFALRAPDRLDLVKGWAA
jgi:hypothetical protein